MYEIETAPWPFIQKEPSSIYSLFVPMTTTGANLCPRTTAVAGPKQHGEAPFSIRMADLAATAFIFQKTWAQLE
ncbi:hypothetical protein [Edaphobacter modestus]|uniref:Uncharacterized protein n=1 Tax=Edaphobacter modestus TaxID=388466 RepID=A0A4Q7YX12_9BACT|nr:hypothetical protein [Edaphobacter modestus]RZU42248.1 hypothetical protein BDD14_3802 [Edaphobacter modestus]